MTDITFESNLSLNQRTAQRILSLPEETEIEMNTYSTLDNDLNILMDSSINDCKTPACGVGHLALQENYPKEFIVSSKDEFFFDYSKYQERLVEDHDTSIFLFHGGWVSTLFDLKLRAAYVYEHGKAPKLCLPDDYIDSTYFSGVKARNSFKLKELIMNSLKLKQIVRSCLVKVIAKYLILTKQTLNQKTAKRILNLPDDSVIDMSMFTLLQEKEIDTLDNLLDSNLNTCSTPACGVGHLALREGYPEKFRVSWSWDSSKKSFNYTRYRRSLTFDAATDVFLFDGGWVNTLEDLKARARYVYKYAKAPSYFDPYCYFHSSFTKGLEP